MCEKGPAAAARCLWRALAIAVCLALVSAIAVAQAADRDARDVAARLSAVVAKLPAQTQVGLVVVDVSSGQHWFDHLPRTPLKPASVLKLFVTAAALEQFGPDFRYETSAYAQGGELVVIGAGDPSLGDRRVAEHAGLPLDFPFDRWADALKARGLERVERIVLDDSIFDRQWRHPDWPPDQATAWYQAPAGALNCNDNCVDTRIVRKGREITLILHPELPASFVENSLRVGTKQRPLVRRSADRDVFEFDGTVTKSTYLGPVSALRPTVFFGHALKQTLLSRGIEVPGDVVRREGTLQSLEGETPLYTHVTPLPTVLWRCNTFSQNMFAECLLKSLVAYTPEGRRTGQAGSWELGTRRERVVLGGMGVDMSGAVLRDGSGLSHDNRVTAEQVVAVLVSMAHHRHAAVFADSLAVPGEPGSMLRRYTDPVLVGRLRGKTGTIDGVRALAGYVTRPDGTRLAFALLCNGGCTPDLPVSVAGILAEGGNSR